MTLISRKSVDFSKFTFQSPQVANLLRVVGTLKKEANFFERFGVDEAISFVAASIEKKFRGQGLVTEMYRRSLVLLRARGFKYVQGVLTSPYTRKTLFNLGFTELAKIYFKDFKTEDGQQLFPNFQPDLFANFMYLEL